MDIVVEDNNITEANKNTDGQELEIPEDNSKSDDKNPVDDHESFLQDYLSKRPQTDMPMFQRVISHEETQAKERNTEDDLKLYQDACADLADCVSDIADIKSSKAEGWKESVNELRKEGAFITLIMKKLNRIEKTRTKISRDKVIKERHLVDQLQLKLDNLMCEMQHLKKEIDKCLKFKSRPLGIDLVTTNEFFEKAPLNVSKPEVTKTDEHELQLARLEWELQQRKELSALLKDLEEKRTSTVEQINKKEKDLNSLSPLIKEILVVSQPLHEKLGATSIKSCTTTSELAPFLPDPMYFLYIQSVSYCDLYEKSISINIKGNIEEARRNHTSESANEEEIVVNLEENEEPETRKNKLDAAEAKLFKKHPLSISMSILVKGGSRVNIEFSYLTNLQIITVSPSLSVSSALKTPTTDQLLQNSTILANLYPGDSGAESPNAKNFYQLQKAGLEDIDITKYGWPYVWAQRVCGLNFIGSDSRLVEPKRDLSKLSIPLVFKDLKMRAQARVALISQIVDLERGDVIGPKSMKSIKLSCSLKSWKSISWTDYTSHPATSHFSNTRYISEQDLFFQGLIAREEATLNVLVALKPEYPSSAPVFALQFVWKDNSWSANNKTDILDMEKEINVFWKELITSKSELPLLLNYQLYKAMLCFDITLETLDPEAFPCEKKTLTQPFRGRNRVHPLKFMPVGDGLFTQRL